jgi:hypothetical protein
MASTSPSSTPCNTPDYTGCTYQSVTLSAGEQFILPPGAVLVSASDINNITSLDNCLDTSHIEPLQSYLFLFGGTSHDNGTPYRLFETNTQTIYALRIGSQIIDITDIPNSAGYGKFDVDSIASSLRAVAAGTLYSYAGYYAGDQDHGYVSGLKVCTYPSVGKDMALQVRTDVAAGDTGTLYYEAKAISCEEYSANPGGGSPIIVTCACDYTP